MLHLYQTTSNIDLCLNCKQNIDEPKLLPCGNTICTCCEKEIISIDNERFECTICNKTHIKDNNELPVNQSLKKLIKVRLTSNYQQLVDNVKNIDDLVTNLEDNMESKIKSHCENLRYQVDLSTESEIESLNLQIEILNKNREEMLDTINRFEKKKISEVQNFLKEECEQSTAILMNEFERLKTEFQKYNEDNCEKLIEQTNDLKNRLEEKKNQVDKVFKSDLLYFHESNLSHIGQLNTIPNLGSMIERIKLVGKNKIDYAKKHRIVKDSFASINRNGCIAIVLKCNHTGVSGQVNNENKIKLYNGKAMFTKNLGPGNLKHACLSEKLLFLIYNESLVFPNSYVGSKFIIIESYDLNTLVKLNSSKLPNSESIKCFLNDDKLFLISIKEPFIHIFNTNLEHLESFGTSKLDVYKISSNNIFIRNDLIIVQNDRTIDVISEKTGKLCKTLTIEAGYNVGGLTDSLQIIVFNPTNYFIRAYNLDGIVTNEFAISNIEEISSIDINEGGRVLIHDKRNLLLYSC
jgi:hypothetical protein